MRYFLLTIALLFALPVFAQDSGIWDNEARNGEGLVITRNGGTLQFFWFTHWELTEYGCYVDLPPASLITEDNCSRDRWFLSGGNDSNGPLTSGILYLAFGTDFPEGVENPDNPFQQVVGDTVVVGYFTLARTPTGWKLKVVKLGDVLDDDDPIYSHGVYTFDRPVFLSDEGPQVNPQ